MWNSRFNVMTTHEVFLNRSTVSPTFFSFLLQVDMEISHFRRSCTLCKFRFFSFRQIRSTLAIDWLSRTCFPVLGHMSALSHGFTTLAGTLLRATVGCRFLMKTVGVLGGCDCDGEVIVPDVEAVFPRGQFIGVCSLLMSIQVLGSQLVRGVDSARRPNCNPPGGVAQGGLLIPVIRHWVRCRRRWRETKWWKWVRNVEDWFLKHAVRVDDSQGAQVCNTSPSCLDSWATRMCAWKCHHVRDTDKMEKNVRGTRCSACSSDSTTCQLTSRGTNKSLVLIISEWPASGGPDWSKKNSHTSQRLRIFTVILHQIFVENHSTNNWPSHR